MPSSATGDILDQARALAVQGELLRARIILEQAGAPDPEVRFALAAILLQSGEYAEGLALLDVLEQSGTRSATIQAYRGGALIGLGRVADAKDIIDAAFTAEPDNFYVALKRGELYCRLGIYPTAVEALERAVRAEGADALGREAARRLLRFARAKARDGFVRRLSPRTWRARAGKMLEAAT